MKLFRYPVKVFTDCLSPSQEERHLVREREIGDYIKRSLATPNVRFPEPMMRTIAFYPGSVVTMGPGAIQQTQVKHVLQKDSFCALLYLLYHYSHENATLLEPTILRDGEALYQYLDWADEQKVQLRMPPERYREYLAQDPFWAMQRIQKRGDESLKRAMMMFVKNNHATSSGAAFVHCMSPSVPNATSFTPVLCQDPLYAVLASIKLRTKGVTISAGDLGQGLTPRWAYHFLAEGIPSNPAGFETILRDDPAWWLEYQSRSGRLETRMLDVGRSYNEHAAGWSHHPYVALANDYLQSILNKAVADGKTGGGGASVEQGDD
jgi:hypothetical protein